MSKKKVRGKVRDKRAWERITYTPAEARALIGRMVANGEWPIPPPRVPPPTREEVEARFKELEDMFPKEVAQAKKYLIEHGQPREGPLVVWVPRK